MRQPLLGILACVVLIAASCQSSIPSSAPPDSMEPGTSAEPSAGSTSNLAENQVLRVILPIEPSTLDPTIGAGAIEVSVIHALHRGLVTLDQDLNVVPELAESWDISDDARTLTFRLRDAQYSNSDPIVAGDLVYSMRRLADPRIAAPYSYAVAEIVGGPELLAMLDADPAPTDAQIDDALDGLGVEAPDDKTLIVHLAAPASYFLSVLTEWVFVPIQEKWITSQGATEAGNHVSSGPFVLDIWQHDNQIVLKPNPYWWGKVKPTLSEIQMTISADPHAGQAAYEAGEIDMVVTPSEDVRRVRDDPILGAQYREATQLAVNYYSYNNYQNPNAASYGSPGPTANRDFRIALTQAIDKQALIDLTFAGLGRVANSFIMPGIPGHQADLNPHPFDLAAAREHMDVALGQLGISSAAELEPLKIGYPSGGPNAEAKVAFLAEAWKQAFGLDFEQVPTDAHVHFFQMFAGEYDVAFSGWGADYPHAHNQLSGVFTCAGGNAAQYCNPAFDGLIAKAAAEPDTEKQLAIYIEAQTLLMNDAPFLPLRFAVTPFEVKPYVSGLLITPSDARLPGDLHYETIQILRH